jgi:hypothetical protein
MIKLLDAFGNPASDSYCTPRWLTGLLPTVDLDPCSNPRSTVKARRTYSLEKRLDGLQMPWTGSVFLNFPYSNPLPWAQKLTVEREAGRCVEAIVLCKLDPSTEWWRVLLGGGAPDVWMFERRIQFDEPPIIIDRRRETLGVEKSTTNFASVVIHHGGPKALDLAGVATRWRRA